LITDLQDGAIKVALLCPEAPLHYGTRIT